MAAIDLVDSERYPIHDPASPRRAELVAGCRREMTRNALCRLPDFVLPENLAVMLEELRNLESAQLHMDHPCTVYPWMDNSGFPDDHPRSTLFTRRYSYLITDQLPDDAPFLGAATPPDAAGFTLRES